MNLKTILFSLVFALSATAVSGKISVRGKILNYDGKSIIYYYENIEGIYTPYWKELKPSMNGTFKIEFENEGYGSIKVSYKSMHYRFFHDANSQIYFEIKDIVSDHIKWIAPEKRFVFYDSIKQVSLLKISGDYEAINKFYNRNLRSCYATTRSVVGDYYSHLLFNSPSPSSAMSLLDSLKQIEVNQINQLPWTLNFETPNDQKKEKEIKDFLMNEADAFYGAVFLSAMFLKRKEQVMQLMNDSTINRTIYNRDWEVLIEKLFKQAKEKLKPITSSPDYKEFMESMAYTAENYRQYDFPQNPSMSLDDMVTNRLFKYDTTLFRDAKSKFAYELGGLQLYLNDQLFYSPGLLSAVYDLEAKHPASKHFAFYREKIEKLRRNLEASKLDFAKAKIIRANYDSFDKLIDRFKGKNVLVDIWATWCHPCIEEFSHRNVIQPWMDKGQIEILYISIDKPQWEDRWRQSIKINELQGSHFRADKEFIQDMWSVIGDFTGAIPRYVLIDKEGKIFQSTAAQPSAGGELSKQIESLIGK